MLKNLEELNPNTVTVTEQSHTPCDLDSVESINKLIKKALLSIESELM